MVIIFARNLALVAIFFTLLLVTQDGILLNKVRYMMLPLNLVTSLIGKEKPMASGLKKFLLFYSM